MFRRVGYETLFLWYVLYARGRSRSLVVLFFKRELRKAGTWLKTKMEATGETEDTHQFLLHHQTPQLSDMTGRLNRPAPYA